MTNPKCDNELVKWSRDCTELDEKVGCELLSYFEMTFWDPAKPC